MSRSNAPRRLAVTVLLLAACGGGDSSPGTPTNPSGPNNPQPIAVATVALDRSSATLVAGTTAQLNATLRSATGTVLTGRAVSWSSSAASVASVSTEGLVTGIAPGTTTITVASEGQSASAAITVTPVPVSAVILSVSSATVQVGATTALTAQARAADGAMLTGRLATWSSSNATIATVDAGVVTGVSPGTAAITVSIEGVSVAAQVTVVPVPVSSVLLAPTSLSLVVGTTGTLVATPRSAAGATLGGRAVTWTSSTPTVATVLNGVVTAIAPGSTTVTATSEGIAATANVTVTPVPVASISITPTLDSLVVGTTRTLVATARDAAGNVLSGRTTTWSSSAISVATVQSGVVSAVAPGIAVITASSEGNSGTATITVTAPAPPTNVDGRGAFFATGPYPFGDQTWAIATQSGSGAIVGAQGPNAISGSITGTLLSMEITYAAPFLGYVARVLGTLATVGTNCEVSGLWSDTNFSGGSYVAVRPGPCAPQTAGGNVLRSTLDLRGTFTLAPSRFLGAVSWVFSSQDLASGTLTGTQLGNTITGAVSGARLTLTAKDPLNTAVTLTILGTAATDGGNCRITGIYVMDAANNSALFSAVRPGPCTPR